MQRLSSRGRGFSLIEVMTVISIIVILVAIFAGRNMVKARARAQFTGCCENLKNMSTALHAYANENSGRYPTTAQTLSVLTPKYLVSIPSCPALGSYLAYNYQGSSNPDLFTMWCGGGGGGYHTSVPGIGVGMPQYTLERGLLMGQSF